MIVIKCISYALCESFIPVSVDAVTRTQKRHGAQLHEWRVQKRSWLPFAGLADMVEHRGIGK